MNARETRIKLRSGLSDLGIKEKEIWNKEGSESFEEPEFKDTMVTANCRIGMKDKVYIANATGNFEIDLIDIIKAAYDNTSYGGMVRLERVK